MKAYLGKTFFVTPSCKIPCKVNMIPESGAPLTMIRIRNPVTGISLESRIQDFLGYPCMKWLCWRGKGTREGRKPLDVCVGWQPRPQGFSLKNGWAQSEPLGRGCVGRSASSPVSSDHFFYTLRDSFRAEKRSAQASAHPLPQAQGGLFCVLTELTVFVCCWSSEWNANVCSL